MAFTTVITHEGERWDQLSFRAYGTPWEMRRLIDANPDVGIYDRLPGGGVLTVPVIDGQTITSNEGGLPPWKQ